MEGDPKYLNVGSDAVKKIQQVWTTGTPIKLQSSWRWKEW